MKKTFYNIVLNGLYQVFVILIPIITVPYVSRVLGTYYLGEYSYYGNIVNFLGVIIVFGLSQQGTKKIAEVDFFERRQVFNEFWFLQIISGILVSIGYLIGMFFGSNILYMTLFFPFLISYVFDISWFFIGIGEIKKVVFRNTMIKIATLILILLFVKNENDFSLYIIINSLGMLFSNVVFFYSLNNFLPSKQEKWKLKLNKEYLHSGLVLLIPQVAVQIYTSLDKVIVGNIAGQVELSYYDQSQKIARLVLAIVTSLSIVLMPKMAQISKDSENLKKIFIKSADYTLMISGLMAVGLMVNTANFIPWFFGKNFLPMVPNMFFTSVIIIFISYGGVYANQYTLAKGMFKLYSIPYVVGAIVDLGMNILLVSTLKSMGGTISLIVTEGVVCLIRMFLLRNHLDLKNILIKESGIFVAIVSTFYFGKLTLIETGNAVVTMGMSAVTMTIFFFLCIWFLYPPFRKDILKIVKLGKNKMRK